jgi:protein FRA10AC1
LTFSSSIIGTWNSFRFLREEEEVDSWESRLAQKYYDKLFKEYCLGDFSRYKTGQVGLRWRTEKECIHGKGHFVCGNLKCDRIDELHSWEVHFRYKEAGESKEALVKIRLCPECTEKLHYGRRRKRKVLDHEDPPKPKEQRFEEPILDEENGDKGSTEDDVWLKPFDYQSLNPKSKEEEMDQFLASMFQ